MSFEEFDDDEFDAEILRNREPDQIKWEPTNPSHIQRDEKGHFLPVRFYPCGTPAGARYHRNHGEPVDEACRLAQREYNQQFSGGERKLAVDLDDFGR